MRFFKRHRLCIFFLLAATVAQAQEKLPFEVDPLFDFEQPKTLGLPFAKGLETITIFSPKASDNKYNHGVVLFPFQGMLYAQWQSSSIDEDGADTQVFYSKSSNGTHWEPPLELTKKRANGIKTSGGWWSDGETLVAYICVWPENKSGSKEGYTEYMTSTDGIHWDLPKRVTNADGDPVLGIIEQDVHQLPNGRIITAFHMQPGLTATPYYTDDPLGISGWTSGVMENMPTNNQNMSRELEPSWFYRSDGAIVMIFRDQDSSFKKLAAVSHDNAVTWTTPVVVNTPDSRAKQSAGNLPNGTAFMVNNPSGNKDRFPLVLTLSKDGFLFDKAWVLRSGDDDLQPMRFDGKYKRPGYSYPKSVVWGDHLYVSYATNKEDVELTRIHIDNLKK
ncbi:BNR repeat-like domain-containing protein [Nonlabens sp. Hel1_33_55]|uniref:sialidase family protein n=1 Tax=Nonlabens sp. Hel1_33_55 TaxID=1336802 RepID=UPI000875AA5D|nr:sialidase family protein [Nonlabens sp. Hel1_33_55]SCY06931.1 BNR repeat-like domain-containing protein [Nonlabens sp. Hel1_33_55]